MITDNTYKLETMLYQRCLYDNSPEHWLKWVRQHVTEQHQDLVKAVLYKLNPVPTDTIDQLSGRFYRIMEELMEDER